MPDTREPAYRMVAREYEHRIRTQQPGYGPGHVMPNLRQLMRESGYGRDTIVSAQKLLEDIGLLTRRRGYGALVREHREREIVHAPAGAEIHARMPTLAELELWDLDPGVPMLVVDGRAYPGDRFELRAGDSEPPSAPEG